MIDQERQINSEMVTLARESRGLTQSQLSERLDIHQGALSKIENGLRGVSEELLQKLSHALHYPVEFFSQPDHVHGLGTSGLFHRKRQDISPKLLNRIEAQLDIRRIHLSRMLHDVDIGEPSIPILEGDQFNGSIEDMARMVRASWRLPGGPVQNLTRTLEAAGGLIIPVEFDTPKIDAISLCHPGIPPIFFINVQSPPDRLRFTLCHELGHVVMHQKSSYPDVDIEVEADRFAAEFLMPAKEIKPQLGHVTLQTLATLKPYWKVAMAALLKRARDLGTVTERQYRYLWVQMSQAKLRQREPDLGVPVESPTLYYDIIAAYRDRMGYSAAEFAHVVKAFEDEVRQVYYTERRQHLTVIK